MEISFIISTGGQRHHISKTIASCHAEGASLDDYEIVVAGETVDIADHPRHRKVHIPLPRDLPVNVYVWQDAVKVARHEWVTFIPDDGVFGRGWAGRVRSYRDPPPATWGATVEPGGKTYPKDAMTNRSIIGVFRRDLFDRFPLDRRWGEDARWCKRLHEAGIPWRFDQRLRWIHHGHASGLKSTARLMYMYGQGLRRDSLPLSLKELTVVPGMLGKASMRDPRAHWHDIDPSAVAVSGFGVYRGAEYVGGIPAGRFAALLKRGLDAELESRIVEMADPSRVLALEILIDSTEPARLAAASIVIVAHPDVADHLTFAAKILSDRSVPTIILGARGDHERVEDRIVSWMGYPDSHLDRMKVWLWDTQERRSWASLVPGAVIDTRSLAAMPPEEAAECIAVLAACFGPVAAVGNTGVTSDLTSTDPMSSPSPDAIPRPALEKGGPGAAEVAVGTGRQGRAE